MSAADQQQLRDGDSVLRISGLPLAYLHTPSFRENKRLARQIAAEERRVQAQTAAARVHAADQRERELRAHAATYRNRIEESAAPGKGSDWWQKS